MNSACETRIVGWGLPAAAAVPAAARRPAAHAWMQPFCCYWAILPRLVRLAVVYMWAAAIIWQWQVDAFHVACWRCLDGPEPLRGGLCVSRKRCVSAKPKVYGSKVAVQEGVRGRQAVNSPSKRSRSMKEVHEVGAGGKERAEQRQAWVGGEHVSVIYMQNFIEGGCFPAGALPLPGVRVDTNPALDRHLQGRRVGS